MLNVVLQSICDMESVTHKRSTYQLNRFCGKKNRKIQLQEGKTQEERIVLQDTVIERKGLIMRVM